MKRLVELVGYAALLAIASVGMAGQVALPPELTGLVTVKAKNVDNAYLLPGADFRTYTKIMIDPAEVAFRKDWLRNMNQQSRSTSRMIDEKDAQEIAAAARSGFGDIWQEAFHKAGYEIAETPGPGVLRLSPAIVDLYINAPDVMAPGRSRTYAVEAGEATLVLEARDSETGATLGYATDQRRTRSYGGRMTWTTSVSNRSNFGALFRQWADICVSALQDLKSKSPITAPQPKAPKT
jgi:hypothetical protein